jgi:ADP-heptose:LPS heptosyltransferase
MGLKRHPQRVLAISTTAIGDTLLGTPAMDALSRYCELDVLVHMRCAELLQGRKGIRRLYTYRNNPFLRAWLGLRLCTRFYDRVVVLHSNDDILRLLPRLRYKKAANTQGWDRPELRLVSLRVPEVAHFTLERLRLAAWCGAPAEPAPMRLELGPELLAFADDWLGQNGLAGNAKGLVLLCPGAARSYKRWPAKSFGRVAANLGEAGYAIAVAGSASEKGLHEQIARIHPGAKPLLGLPLMQAAAVISRADLLITNDTGTLHMAQAAGTKTLAIFGPTPEKRYAPQNPGSRTLKVDLPCEPCLGVDCAKPVCMEALKVKTVLDTALKMLDEENNQLKPANPGEKA